MGAGGDERVCCNAKVRRSEAHTTSRQHRPSHRGIELVGRQVASHYGINLFDPERFSGFSLRRRSRVCPFRPVEGA